MPELADVEGWRRYVARFARGRRVRGVSAPDPSVLRNTSPQGLGRALAGHRLGAPERRGKWLLVPAGDGRLVLHFGMTGELHWSGRPGALDRFDRVVLALRGGELRYRTRRKLGGVWWLGRGRALEELSGPLGPDAARISREAFRARLSQRRGGLKSALMDQTLLAGLGNELSDEILWRARLGPRARSARLSSRQLDGLYRTLRDVLRSSMRHGRIPTGRGWLTGVRGSERAACPRCGRALRRERVAGRTAYWCPRCQETPGGDDA